MTTTYTLDLASALTQVLQDGTHTYLYGLGRIAQINRADTTYFLGDRLGSVRQLADAGGGVTLAAAYDPYGSEFGRDGTAQTIYGFDGEQTDAATKMVYLRARYYEPLDGRFVTKDTWGGDETQPMSHNAWLYVLSNPINYTDPSGRSPLGQNPCEGQPNYEICYARWVVNNGGDLTADIIKSIYNVYPDETLQLLKRQFNIKLPTGYNFRIALGGTAFREDFNYDDIFGVTWWFTQYIPIGTIIDISGEFCGLFSSDVPSLALVIDYSIYVTKHTYPDWKFRPDDIAGIMLHEAVHAWQESVARDHLVNPGQAGDPSSYSWFIDYGNGMERQAIDYVLAANNNGRIAMSSRLKWEFNWYRFNNSGGPRFPFTVPPAVP